MYQVEIFDILNQAHYTTTVESKTPMDAKYDAIQKLCNEKGNKFKEYLMVNKVLEVI